mgnify:CR=1 FL=1
MGSINLEKISCLEDINFATHYIFATKGGACLSKLIRETTKNAIDIDTKSELSGHIYRFYSKHILRSKNKLRPLTSCLEEEIKRSKEIDTFLKYVKRDDSAIHDSLVHSMLPQYFLDHPIEGLVTTVCEDFSSQDINLNELYIAKSEFLNNCFNCGTIRSRIEFRIGSARNNTCNLKAFTSFMNNFNLSLTKPQRLNYSNDIQTWSVFLEPNENDKKVIELSDRFKTFLHEHLEKNTDGNKYLLCADEKPVSDKGFKDLTKVKSLLKGLSEEIYALDAPNPISTTAFLKSTLLTFQIMNKKGEFLDLKKYMPVKK